jgi:N-acyl-D-amino-acid deacylase
MYVSVDGHDGSMIGWTHGEIAKGPRRERRGDGHRSTGPAAQSGIDGRGALAEGNFADVVVFERDTIGADIEPGHLKTVPTGIGHVLVNGDFVVRDGVATNDRPGEIGVRR